MRTDLIKPLPVAVVENATRFADKVAFEDDRRAVTYGDLEARTRRLAGHLAGLGVRPGDRVAICLGNTVSTVESYLAIVRASGIGVPLNPASALAELEYLLTDSGATVVITDSVQAERLQRSPAVAAGITLLVTGDVPAQAGAYSYDEFAVSEPARTARDDLGLDDVAWMFYTSGTTGRPKGVLSTQRNCLWSVASCYVPIPGLTDQDRVLWPLPLFHSLSHIACVLSVTVVGATARIMDGSSAEDVISALREDNSTFLAGVPTTYHHLVTAAQQNGFSAPALRIGLVGGAVTGSRLRQGFEEVFGVPLVDAYGSTETCGAITINPPDGARVDGSCGLPVPGVGVRIVNPTTGLDVPVGQEGRCGSADRTSWSATTTARRRPPPRCRTAGTGPETWPGVTTPATSPSAAGSRNSSSAAGRTSTPRKSRQYCAPSKVSPTRRLPACRTTRSARCRSRTWSPAPPGSTPRR